jgi:hypothetical protein
LKKLSRTSPGAAALIGMDAPPNPLDLAERVSGIARGLGIETVLIGAYALVTSSERDRGFAL